MPDRAQVFAAIESEYDYARRKWGDVGKNHEIASWLAYMQSYLSEAIDLASRNSPETIALDTVRKVANLAVCCMQEHGAPLRKETDHA